MNVVYVQCVLCSPTVVGRCGLGGRWCAREQAGRLVLGCREEIGTFCRWWERAYPGRLRATAPSRAAAICMFLENLRKFFLWDCVGDTSVSSRTRRASRDGEQRTPSDNGSRGRRPGAFNARYTTLPAAVPVLNWRNLVRWDVDEQKTYSHQFPKFRVLNGQP